MGSLFDSRFIVFLTVIFFISAAVFANGVAAAPH